MTSKWLLLGQNRSRGTMMHLIQETGIVIISCGIFPIYSCYVDFKQNSIILLWSNILYSNQNWNSFVISFYAKSNSILAKLKQMYMNYVFLMKLIYSWEQLKLTEKCLQLNEFRIFCNCNSSMCILTFLDT